MTGGVPITITQDTSKRLARRYGCRNPIHQWVLRRFHRRIRQWIDEIRPRRVLDFGCGEGYFWEALRQFGPLPEVVGLDVRPDAIEAAQARLPHITFLARDLFELDLKSEYFDLVIASQVLEHLYDPARFLNRLCMLSSMWVLLTVPNEPFFRFCNFARGRDVFRLGNHPEHVQHWSKPSFRLFVSDFLEIKRLETVFPFVLLLGRRKGMSQPVPAACMK